MLNLPVNCRIARQATIEITTFEARERKISMKKVALVLFCAVVINSGSVSAHDRKIGLLMDATCGQRLADSPEEAASHLVSCSLRESCVTAGFGVLIEGKFYKFDKMGDKLALMIFQSTDKKANVRVRVDAHFDKDVISPAILEPFN